jgi:hypothetical protein
MNLEQIRASTFYSFQPKLLRRFAVRSWHDSVITGSAGVGIRSNAGAYEFIPGRESKGLRPGGLTLLPGFKTGWKTESKPEAPVFRAIKVLYGPALADIVALLLDTIISGEHPGIALKKRPELIVWLHRGKIQRLSRAPAPTVVRFAERVRPAQILHGGFQLLNPIKIDRDRQNPFFFFVRDIFDP